MGGIHLLLFYRWVSMVTLPLGHIISTLNILFNEKDSYFLPALSRDDIRLVLAKHDTRTMFVFSTVSVCHWCLVTVILSKC